MKSLIRHVTATALVFMAAITLAWAQAPSISWTDATGDHTVTLVNVPNPDYGDIIGVDPEYVWFGILNITMDTTDPIVFTGSGNFIAEWGEVWDQVRIKQNVTNNTNVAWTDFHLQSPDFSAEFYKVFEYPSGWGYSCNLDVCDFVADAPEYYIDPTEVFEDGVVFWVYDIDWGTGDGSFTITKEPTYVPEPGSCAALMGGLIGFITLYKRRKA